MYTIGLLMLFFLRKAKISVLVAYGSPAFLLLLHRAYLSLELMEIGRVTRAYGVDLNILPFTLANVVVGYGILMGYCAPLLIRSGEELKPSYSKGVLPVVLIFYCVFMTAIYVWDPFREVSQSPSNLARYLAPVTPLMVIHIKPPKNLTQYLLAIGVSCTFGSALGLYLVYHSNLHGPGPISWEHFIAQLQTSS